jgi:hypothetical protein
MTMLRLRQISMLGREVSFFVLFVDFSMMMRYHDDLILPLGP